MSTDYSSNRHLDLEVDIVLNLQQNKPSLIKDCKQQYKKDIERFKKFKSFKMYQDLKETVQEYLFNQVCPDCNPEDKMLLKESKHITKEIVIISIEVLNEE